jgi:uncharacterized membrane protein YadS
MPGDNPSVQFPVPILQSDDWWAVWLGLFVFVLGLGPIYEKDLLGWVVQHQVWTEIGQSVRPISKGYGSLSGVISSILTYLFMLGLTSIAVKAMGRNLLKYAISFTIIFWVVFGCMIASNYAYIAATPEMRADLEIPWSLSLGDKGFVIAIILGLIVGNFFPSCAKFLNEAARPEWFIKAGIVIMGAVIGARAVEALNLAGEVIVVGLCLTIVSQLICWPLVYFVSRKLFRFTPEWVIPLTFGCSTSGASAVIATGGAIRSGTQVMTLLSSVIIIFSVLELQILPWFAQTFLYREPFVAGAWIGLAIKTDGGVIGAGGLTDSLVTAKAWTDLGISWTRGWVLMTAITTRVFIDSFVGVWTFIVAVLWSLYRLDGTGAVVRTTVSPREIWERFPKFIIGFTLTFLVILLIGLANPQTVKAAQTGSGHANAVRTLFFGLCFFSVGLAADIRKVLGKGIGRVMAVYGFCVFGFIIWIGLFICWVFYHGVAPPLMVK